MTTTVKKILHTTRKQANAEENESFLSRYNDWVYYNKPKLSNAPSLTFNQWRKSHA